MCFLIRFFGALWRNHFFFFFFSLNTLSLTLSKLGVRFDEALGNTATNFVIFRRVERRDQCLDGLRGTCEKDHLGTLFTSHRLGGREDDFAARSGGAIGHSAENPVLVPSDWHLWFETNQNNIVERARTLHKKNGRKRKGGREGAIHKKVARRTRVIWMGGSQLEMKTIPLYSSLALSLDLVMVGLLIVPRTTNREIRRRGLCTRPQTLW
jgi:hypothetical protein